MAVGTLEWDGIGIGELLLFLIKYEDLMMYSVSTLVLLLLLVVLLLHLHDDGAVSAVAVPGFKAPPYSTVWKDPEMVPVPQGLGLDDIHVNADGIGSLLAAQAGQRTKVDKQEERLRQVLRRQFPDPHHNQRRSSTLRALDDQYWLLIQESQALRERQSRATLWESTFRQQAQRIDRNLRDLVKFPELRGRKLTRTCAEEVDPKQEQCWREARDHFRQASKLKHREVQQLKQQIKLVQREKEQLSQKGKRMAPVSEEEPLSQR